MGLFKKLILFRRNRTFLEIKRNFFVSRRFFQQNSPKTSGSDKILSSKGAGNDVFDRNAKRIQRNRAASIENFEEFEYLKSEIAYRVADRVYDVKKFFDVAVDFGSGTGLMAPHIFKENVGVLIQMDMSEIMVQKAKNSDEVPTLKLVADEELVPFKSQSIDLAISSLSMHWINNLPAFFQRVHDALRPDGVLIGAMFGGETLYQLRCSLQLAELERLGGLGAHISPFTEVRDIGSLMNRAGFKMLTVDIDEVEISYSSMLKLMYEIQAMGESSAAWRRSKHLNRDVLAAASAIYKEMYGKPGDLVNATFQIIYMIGWRAGEHMPQPAKRGSGTISFKDLGAVIKNPPK